MIEQKIEESEQLRGSVLERYASHEQQMNELYDGTTLRDAAERVIRHLPEGGVELLSTSEQGAGLAAACAALRDEPTCWRRVNLLLGAPAGRAGQVVFVEMVDPGAGWRDAVRRRFPGAELLFAVQIPAGALAA